jgi:hypothetical protein
MDQSEQKGKWRDKFPSTYKKVVLQLTHAERALLPVLPFRKAFFVLLTAYRMYVNESHKNSMC